MVKLAPSILAADFSRLGELVSEVELGGANRIHIDVMDGHFVPNLSMGPVVVKGVRPHTSLPLEVHLMVTDPAKFVELFLAEGTDSLIVHYEVLPDPKPLLRQIRQRGKRVGLAINPGTPVEVLEPYFGEVDLVLCMTVWPGFGGQAFLPESLGRLRALRNLLDKHSATCELEVDGGIDANTLGPCAQAGADVFVAGTSIFRAKNGPRAAVGELQQLVKL